MEPIHRLQKAQSLKTSAIWSIVGTILFILPGLIAWFVTLCKIISYPKDEASLNSKSGPIICLLFFNLFFWIGSFLVISYANREIMYQLTKINNKDDKDVKEEKEEEDWD